jgi:hypothetical protein
MRRTAATPKKEIHPLTDQKRPGVDISLLVRAEGCTIVFAAEVVIGADEEQGGRYINLVGIAVRVDVLMACC